MVENKLKSMLKKAGLKYKHIKYYRMNLKITNIEPDNPYNGWMQGRFTFDSSRQVQVSWKDGEECPYKIGDTVEITKEQWAVKGGLCKGLMAVQIKKASSNIGSEKKTSSTGNTGGSKYDPDGQRRGNVLTNAVKAALEEFKMADPQGMNAEVFGVTLKEYVKIINRISKDMEEGKL